LLLEEIMITDTTPEAEERQHEIFRGMSGEQRLCLAIAWSDSVRDISWAGFQRRHPSAGEKELRALILREVHGIEMEAWRALP
jgi:hypothetical protein